jgi:hypothetical protein
MEVISPVQRSAALNRGMFFRIAFSQRQSGRRCGRAQGPAVVILPTRARVQAHRVSSSVLALHEGVPRAMDHHSSGCLPAEKFPTFASGRQGRGATTLSDFRLQFHLTRSRDVAGGRITGIRGWICATSSLGSPVIIVQVRTHSPDSGSFQFSQSPAKVNGLWENWKSEPASK